MTTAELLEGSTGEPALTDEQFEEALRMGLTEFKAEKFVKRRQRRTRAAKYRDLMSDDTACMLTGADAAELLSGLGD
jgi:hypothetical protein